MKSVFVLEHLHILEDGEESWKRIGIYKTREGALDAIDRSNKLPGFSDHPKLINFHDPEPGSGFNIDEYTLDVDDWTDGYVTV